MAGRSLNSIVIEPGVSTHTIFVFGLMSAAIPAPTNGSYCSTVTPICLSNPFDNVFTGSYTFEGIKT